MWTCFRVWIPIWFSYTILFICLQQVREIWSYVWIPSIWSSFPILFIRLQAVREHYQLFEYHSSDHRIPALPYSASTQSWSHIWIPANWSSSSSVIRMFVSLVNRLNSTHLTILSLFFCLQIVRKLGRLLEYTSFDYPIQSSLSVSRSYVNLANCLKNSHLIPPHLLHLSPGSTWIL